ncbi:hypothetical protein D920_00504 [Enterococcus faecalis 13-SD-W-01]|nr:hypothetical protein D920_00504 [Enterococcus faecalis 13-SD-W-01]
MRADFTLLPILIVSLFGFLICLSCKDFAGCMFTLLFIILSLLSFIL